MKKKLIFAALMSLITTVGYGASKEYQERELDFNGQQILVKKTGKPANGYVKEYDNNGQIWAEETLKDGKFHGLRKMYSPSGVLESETNFKNGKLDGVQKWYYPSGTLKRESYWLKGKRNFMEKSFYESGVLQREEFYTDNVMDSVKLYYDNGRQWCEAQYKNGVLDGTASSWSYYGASESQIEYKDGKIDGKSINWFPNGITVEKIVQYNKGRAEVGYIDPNNTYNMYKKMNESELIMNRVVVTPCNAR